MTSKALDVATKMGITYLDQIFLFAFRCIFKSLTLFSRLLMSRAWWESNVSIDHFHPPILTAPLFFLPFCIISVSIFMFCASVPPHTDIHPHFLLLLSFFCCPGFCTRSASLPRYPPPSCLHPLPSEDTRASGKSRFSDEDRWNSFEASRLVTLTRVICLTFACGRGDSFRHMLRV